MLRRLALTGIAAAFVAGVAGTATAVPEQYVRPCHGTTYKYGAIVTNPVSGQEYRMCIEQ